MTTRICILSTGRSRTITHRDATWIPAIPIPFSVHEAEYISNLAATVSDPLTDEEIEEYIKTPEPYDKAGGYGIQNKAALFVKGIKGDYFNVVGLPIARLKREIDTFLQQDFTMPAKPEKKADKGTRRIRK